MSPRPRISDIRRALHRVVFGLPMAWDIEFAHLRPRDWPPQKFWTDARLTFLACDCQPVFMGA